MKRKKRESFGSDVSIRADLVSKFHVSYGGKPHQRFSDPGRFCSDLNILWFLCGSSQVSLEVFSPAQRQLLAICHLYFLSSFFSIFFTLEFKKLFFSQFFLFSSVFFSALSCFLFKSAFLLFLFSYYSILSASLLCFITIQSVLFLLFVIFSSPLSNTYFPLSSTYSSF